MQLATRLRSMQLQAYDDKQIHSVHKYLIDIKKSISCPYPFFSAGHGHYCAGHFIIV